MTDRQTHRFRLEVVDDRIRFPIDDRILFDIIDPVSLTDRQHQRLGSGHVESAVHIDDDVVDGMRLLRAISTEKTDVAQAPAQWRQFADLLMAHDFR